MKKIIAVIVTFAVLFPNVCFASSIDISNLSDEELIVLQKQINQEVETRINNTGIKLPAGRYIVGRDFPEGKYYFILTKFDSKWGNYVNVFPSVESFSKAITSDYMWRDSPKEAFQLDFSSKDINFPYVLELKEGYVLDAFYNSAEGEVEFILQLVK